MRYIIAYSGGHSSALAAIETVRKYGKNNVVLLNHNISSEVEHEDIKRFKKEVAAYLGLKVTYANMKGWREKTPLRVCRELGAFKVGNGQALCTYYLKTAPFHEWLKDNFPTRGAEVRNDVCIVYGFDENEKHRIQRRIGVLSLMGYKSDYPLALWDRTIFNTENIGIKRPVTYKLFRHANCIGCLKAGKQQWYLVYCLFPYLWDEAKETEKEIGYSILKQGFLEDFESEFEEMKAKGICPSEKVPPAKFWSMVAREMPGQVSMLPCECAL